MATQLSAVSHDCACASRRRRRSIARESSRPPSPSSRRGFKGASMDAIAARTSTTRALINYYFGSKEKLYLAVLEQVYAEIRDAEHLLDLDHLPPVEAICRIVEFTYNCYVEHEDFVRLVVAENQAQGRHMKRSAALRTINRPIVDTLGCGDRPGPGRRRRSAPTCDADRRPHGDRRARDVQRHESIYLRRNLPAGYGREGGCARRRRHGGRHGPELAQPESDC